MEISDRCNAAAKPKQTVCGLPGQQSASKKGCDIQIMEATLQSDGQELSVHTRLLFLFVSFNFSL